MHNIIEKAEIIYNPLTPLSDKDKAMCIVNALKRICADVTEEYIKDLCALKSSESGKRVWEEEIKKESFMGLTPSCPYHPERQREVLEKSLEKMNQWKDIEAFAEQTFIKGE